MKALRMKPAEVRSKKLRQDWPEIIFIHGYAKNQVSTLKPKELKAVRKAAKEMLNWTDEEVDELVKQDVLQEIEDGQE